MSAVLDRIQRLGAVLRDEDASTLALVVKPAARGEGYVCVHLAAYDGSGNWAQTARFAEASSYDMACEALYAALYKEVEAERARLTAALD